MSDSQIRARLRGLFLMKGVSESGVDFCLGHKGLSERSYAKGDIIFDPAHFQRALGVVLSGRVKAFKPKGEQVLPLRVFQEGDVFGAAALFGSEEYVTCLKADTDCRVLFLSQALVADLIGQDGRAAMNYVRFLSDRIRFLNQKIDSFTAGSAENRLARYLLSLSLEEGKGVVPCSLSELAKTLDIGRASLYRALDSLEQSGIIGRAGHHITILDRDQLTERME